MDLAFQKVRGLLRSSVVEAARLCGAGLLFCLLVLAVLPLPVRAADDDPSAFGPATIVGGRRPLALIVGINRYSDPGIENLLGAVKDARNYASLLSGPGGYGFPAENITLLIDERATRSRFLEAFEKGLIERAQAGDPVVLVFAGHGSQFVDLNDDEADGIDETLLFHDSRKSGARHLLDDELNLLLQKLYEKTREITVILDACHSGSMVRGGPRTPRFSGSFREPSTGEIGAAPNGKDSKGDGGGWEQSDLSYNPASMPEAVFIRSAMDGSAAYDTARGGVFSQAFFRAMSQIEDRPPTYALLERRLRQYLAVDGYQPPRFEGPVDKPVFSKQKPVQPRCWSAVEVCSEQYGDRSQRIIPSGLPLPGWSPGAELRIFPPPTRGSEGRSPVSAQALTIEIVAEKGRQAFDSLLAKSSPPLRLLPEGYPWRIRVSLTPDAPAPLYVTGFVISSDGLVFDLPYQGATLILRPGEDHLFDHPRELFAGVSTPGTYDHVLILGSPAPMEGQTLETFSHGWAGRLCAHNPFAHVLDRFPKPRSNSRIPNQNPPRELFCTHARLALETVAHDPFQGPVPWVLGFPLNGR